jgi:hypothetical protein
MSPLFQHPLIYQFSIIPDIVKQRELIAEGNNIRLGNQAEGIMQQQAAFISHQ